MNIFLIAFIGTLIVLAVLVIGRLAFARREPFDARKFGIWLGIYFVVNYIISLLIVYFAEPALTGPFWGFQWTLGPLVISSIANLFAFARPALGVLEDASAASQGRAARSRISRGLPANASRGAIAAGIFGLAFAALIGLVVAGLIVVFTTWFDSNAKALANIPNVTMEPPAAVLPPTDPTHIVLVSQSVASYKGQQVLGSNGENLGSTYNLDSTSYTLQSINQHLYYVAPLSYNNIFANLQSSTTPGFVVVDAEDPQQVPQLCTNKFTSSHCPTDHKASLAYLPGALLNQDLLRHVYLGGYTYGKLLDPTLELDDSFHPYWTISLMQPIRGYTGDSLVQVLIVDAHTGDITAYDPNAKASDPKQVPVWVDRVLPADTVNQYLTWWGLYHAAPWFNPSGAGQQTTVGIPQLLYNYNKNQQPVDQPVWLISMTSSSSNDNSSTGIFLFDTHKNEAHFYQLSGLGIGINVSSTIKSTRANIRNYDVDSIQLYQIYGVPTWVAIFVQSSTNGDIFQGVGLVDAKNLNGSNVQFESSLSVALQDYQQWLTQQGNGGGGNPTGGGGAPQTVMGKVLRVSVVQQGSNTIYYLLIAGQNQIFTANLSLSAKLPLVQAGDIITGDYTIQGNQANFKNFDDLSINLGGTPTPSGTPTSTGTPTR